MARSKTSSAWMREHVTDPFVKRARREGLRARSAFKLEELAARDRLFRPGMRVVDLGAAPGSWSQVAARLVGAQGRVFAVDLLSMAPLAGVRFVHGDFREERVLRELEQQLAGQPVDLVLSDMAPNISGIAATDQARAMHLAELALEFALRWLKPGGTLLVKCFQGSEFEALRARMRRSFREVLMRKPQASRDRSSEVYLLGRGLVPGAGTKEPGGVSD